MLSDEAPKFFLEMRRILDLERILTSHRASSGCYDAMLLAVLTNVLGTILTPYCKLYPSVT